MSVYGGGVVPLSAQAVHRDRWVGESFANFELGYVGRGGRAGGHGAARLSGATPLPGLASGSAVSSACAHLDEHGCCFAQNPKRRSKVAARRIPKLCSKSRAVSVFPV